MRFMPPFCENRCLSCLEGRLEPFGCEWNMPKRPSIVGIIHSEKEDIVSETIMPGGIMVSSITIVLVHFSLLPISKQMNSCGYAAFAPASAERRARRRIIISIRSEEHTSELQSHFHFF